MFYWPNCELTEYEKRFVSLYPTQPKKDKKTGKVTPGKPGVLRRTYKVLLNNFVNTQVIGLEALHFDGSVEMSRRTRVFALTFAGDLSVWPLRIYSASGEDYTPRTANGNYPTVSAMVPCTQWLNFASDFPAFASQVTTPAGDVRQFAYASYPLIIDPNWELVQNESLIFSAPNGDPLPGTDVQLEIAVHAWEFPGMVEGAEGPIQEKPRMGAGPVVGGRKC